MKEKAKLLCSLLLLSLIMVFPAMVGGESAVPLYEKSKRLFEQLQDLEAMQRNVEDCYQVEKRMARVGSWSGQSNGDADLNGNLMKRVLDHLAGTREHEMFITEYRALVQHPDYRRFHTDELFGAYIRLLESGRSRFLTQLKEWQESSTQKCSIQARPASEQDIAVRKAAVMYAEGSQREPQRVMQAMSLQLQMPPSISKQLTGDRGVSRLVVPWIDKSASTNAAAPESVAMEVCSLFAQERAVPLEQLFGGFRGFMMDGLQRTDANTSFSDLSK